MKILSFEIIYGGELMADEWDDELDEEDLEEDWDEEEEDWDEE